MRRRSSPVRRSGAQKRRESSSPRLDAFPTQNDSPVLPRCDPDAVPWITVAQMREVDRITIGIGVTLERMVENAGAHLALVALMLLGGEAQGRQVTVLAGRGGNGGGGLVAARRLIGWGADVDVRLSDPADALTPVPRQQLEILRATGARVSVGAAALGAADLFVDAILGYSQHGSPRGGAAQLIAATAGARVLSLDVPSGLALEDGRSGEPAVDAAATVTLALPKAGLRSDDGRRVAGALYLADIAVPPPALARAGIQYSSPFTRGPVVALRRPPRS